MPQVKKSESTRHRLWDLVKRQIVDDVPEDLKICTATRNSVCRTNGTLAATNPKRRGRIISGFPATEGVKPPSHANASIFSGFRVAWSAILPLLNENVRRAVPKAPATPTANTVRPAGRPFLDRDVG